MSSTKATRKCVRGLLMARAMNTLCTRLESPDKGVDKIHCSVGRLAALGRCHFWYEEHVEHHEAHSRAIRRVGDRVYQTAHRLQFSHASGKLQHFRLRESLEVAQ